MDSRNTQKKYDWFTVFTVIALLIIPLYLISNMLIFKPSGFGRASNYGVVIFIILVIGALWWVIPKLREKNFSKKVVDTLGFQRSWRQVLIGLFIGCCAGTVMWQFKGGFSLHLLPPSGLVVDMLFVAPIFEEMLFRGYLINRSLYVNRTSRMKILAAVASIFIFSWMHASYPEQKMIGAVVFTVVYLWGWKNNMTAAIMSHLGANAVILFAGFSSLRAVTAIGTLAVITLMTALLILVVWMAHPLARMLIRLWRMYLGIIKPRQKQAKHR